MANKIGEVIEASTGEFLAWEHIMEPGKGKKPPKVKDFREYLLKL